jgi:Flp pilus assembly protein TadG
MNAGGRRESGQTLVLFVIMLGVLMGFVAMSIDVGMVLHERRSLQNAADAAALAGVSELPESPSAAEARALEWAEDNGYTGENGATITVNTPYQGDPDSVEVVIEVEMPFIFARALGLESTDIHARAVASNTTGSVPGVALLALNPLGPDSFVKGGTSDLIINGGGAIMVNDAAQGAIQRSGSGDVVASGGFYHYYQGEWVSTGAGQFIPEPVPVTTQMADPLAGLVPPDPYVVGTSPHSGGTAADPVTKTLNSGDYVLRPGAYWGGIEVRSTANVTFLPGTYVLAGGGLKIVGSGTVTGDGVFFYNTFDPENQQPSADGQCDEINLRGSASFTLTAPTEGPYEDILFWQDAACTNTMKHEGTGDATSGVYYLPSARLDLSGSGNVGSVQIITNTIDISGGSDLIIDFQNFLDIPVPDHYRLTE